MEATGGRGEHRSKVLSRLGRDERYRMARLQISDALWSTWKR